MGALQVTTVNQSVGFEAVVASHVGRKTPHLDVEVKPVLPSELTGHACLTTWTMDAYFSKNVESEKVGLHSLHELELMRGLMRFWEHEGLIYSSSW